MSITEKIIAIREAKGLTKTQIARSLDTELSNYLRIENKDKKLTYEQIEAIAGALGVTVVELLTYGDEQIADQAIAGEIEKLKQEKAILEDRLKDKQELSVRYKIDLESAISTLTHQLEYTIYDKARELKLGRYKSKAGLIIERSNLSDEQASELSGSLDFEWDLTNEEELTAAKQIFVDADTAQWAAMFMQTGLVTEPILIEAFRSYKGLVDITLGQAQSMRHFKHPLLPVIGELTKERRRAFGPSRLAVDDDRFYNYLEGGEPVTE